MRGPSSIPASSGASSPDSPMCASTGATAPPSRIPAAMPGARFFPPPASTSPRTCCASASSSRRSCSATTAARGARSRYHDLHEEVARIAAGLKAAGVGAGRSRRRLSAEPARSRSSRCWRPRASAPSGRRARRTSASTACSIASARSRRRCSFTADGYFYSGKTLDSLGNVAQVLAKLPSIARVVVVGYREREARSVEARRRPRRSPRTGPSSACAASRCSFIAAPFDQPIYILYSSGTTGVPKCIVHGAGGTLLQHQKEHLLHTDIRRDERVFYFTTCGWMMWNWLASVLATGATIVLYDGSPFHPDPGALWKMAARGARQRVRHEREVHRRARRRASFDPLHAGGSVEPARDSLDGLAAAAGELRLRVHARQEGRAARVDLGRHGHRLVLRARRADAAGVSRRASVPRPRHGRADLQ